MQFKMNSNELPEFVLSLLHQITLENGFMNYSMQIENGSQAGDGFMSEIFNITITEKNCDKSLDLVCKVAPFNRNHRKETFANILFSNEVHFYQTIIPAFTKFQKERNMPEDGQFSSYPKCYATIADDDKEYYAIIMENLRSCGFTMWNKAKPSPIDHLRLVMQELGKFHGLSFAMNEQKPEIFMKIKRVKDLWIAQRQSKSIQEMIRANLIRDFNCLSNQYHKNIVDHIKDNYSKYMDDLLTLNRFSVICHGDFWNNNILYRNDDQTGVTKDVRFLDFQQIRYGSPALDLFEILFTSTTKTLREKEYENLLMLYHNSLTRTVEILGSNPIELFTLENLKDELKRCVCYVLVVAPCITRILLCDSNKIPNLGEMFDGVAERQNPINFVPNFNTNEQHEFIRRINELYEDIDNLGYFPLIY